MKKTLSAILAGVFAFSTLSALAAELPGKYPEHNALTARQHRTGTAVPGASPEENVFYVEDDYGGTKFNLPKCEEIKQKNYNMSVYC